MIHIVIDNSGSMRDNGKTSLAASLIMIYHRHAPSNVEVVFYKWDQQICKIDSARDLNFSGTAEEQVLIDFIADLTPAPILLVGDGTVTRTVARTLKKSNSVYLAVGCDSNPDELEHIIGENNVFLWADSITCFQTILPRSAVV